MSLRDRRAVVGADPGTDDGLLLPRAPGFLRRFWARHRRLADVLVAAVAFLLSAPAATFRGAFPIPPTAVEIAFAIVLVALASASLVLRRDRPLMIFTATMIPAVVLPPSLAPASHLMPAFGLYAVAVYRSTRACWTAFGIACAALAVYTGLAVAAMPAEFGFLVSTFVSAVVAMLIGGLIGTNVGGRRRYLDALIDRSRQLLIERDQQAQLATAAERTRIAREMHDIVSHNLTVVVALAEGAAATADPARARAASESIAATARSALEEMRAMLGVLRDPDAAAGTPLAPLGSATVADAVEAAQRAGMPAVLHIEGSLDGLPADVRLAVTRIVQESLTNAMRHAPSASVIDVNIVARDEAIEIVVSNDGTPTTAGTQRARARGGYGIPGLHERVAHVGGSVEVGPAGGDRWIVRASLPRRHAAPVIEELAP